MTTCVGEYEVERSFSPSHGINSTALVGVNLVEDFAVTTPTPTHSLVDLRAYVDAEDPVSMLGRVNYVFSLNYKKLSEAMCVTRPTIYSWLDGETVPDGLKIKRLIMLYSISNYWWNSVGKCMEKEMLSFPIGLGGESIQKMITEESLNFGSLVTALEAISHFALIVSCKKPSLAEKLKKKGRKPKSGAAVDRDLG